MEKKGIIICTLFSIPKDSKIFSVSSSDTLSAMVA
jgi:hypothetical protein